MKLLLLAVVVGACYCARLDNTYLPPAGAHGAGGGPGLSAPFGPRPSGGGAPGFGGRPGGPGGPGFGGPGGAPGPLYGPPSGPGKAGPGGPGPNGFGPGPHGGFGPAGPGGFGPGPQGGGGPDARANILRFDNTPNAGDGSYQFSFETENGIKAEEEGHARPDSNQEEGGEAVRGSFSYTAPDGQQIEITYTADENGFVPQGAHLPTPPPIPEEILRSLEQNAAEEARGGGSDGSYNGGQGGYPSGGPGGRQGGYPSGGPGGYPSGPGGRPSGPGGFPSGGGPGGYPSGGPGGYPSGGPGGYPSGSGPGGYPGGSSSPGAGGLPGARPGGSRPGFNPQTGYSY
ncbi:pupal cuticle protein 36-like [Photinus pyralis]|nr:pupal cuticle protein 36-like [Photinus pyralis]